jgi:hypothetical protein
LWCAYGSTSSLSAVTLALTVTIGWSYTTVLPKGIKRLVQRIPSNAAKHRSDGSGAFRFPGPYPLVLDALKLILARREERRIAADLCEPRERTNNGCREPKEFWRPDDAEVS